MRSPRQRRDVQDRRVVEELHLLPQLVVEPLREVRAPPLHQVPLVGRDDDRRSRPSRPRRRSWRPGRWPPRPSRRAARRRRPCSMARRARITLSASSCPLRATRPARRMPAVSTMRKVRLLPFEHGVHGVAGRARHVADDRALLSQQAIEQRRLADVGPPDDRDRGFLWRVRRTTPAARRRNTPDDLVEQVANALAVLGRDLDDRLEPELVELDRPPARPLVVGLVDRQQHRHLDAAQAGGDLLVAGTSPSRPSTTKTIRSAVCDGSLPLDHDQLMQRILARAEHAAGVDERERAGPATRPAAKSHRASCRRWR